MSIYIIIGLVLTGSMLLLVVLPVNLWITAVFSGVRIQFIELIFMRIRKVPPGLIVRSMILATKAGLKDVTITLL
mgnify:FL=1